MLFPRFRLVVAVGLGVSLLQAGCGGGCNQGALSGSGGFPTFGGRDGGSSGGIGGGGGIGGAIGAAGTAGRAIITGASGIGGFSGAGGRATGGTGSPGGRLGRGGGPTAGTGGRSMTGETCIPGGPAMTCPASMCGNNRRDSCMVPSGSGFCPFVTVTEVCDGTDVGGQSCTGLGFGGGTLVCSSDCTRLETSACDECRASDASILSCGVRPVMRSVFNAAIAGTETEVGLTWITTNAGNEVSLSFARIAPTLDTISLGTLTTLDPDTTYGLRIVPLPQGWLITAYVEPDVVMFAVDAEGRLVKTTVLESIPGVSLWTPPVVAARPGGGALVAWQTNEIHAAVVAADGLSATRTAELASDEPGAALTDVAFIADAYYAAISVVTDTNLSQLRLVRIAPDGTLAGKITALPDAEIAAVSFVEGAPDHRVIFAASAALDTTRVDFAWSVLWQRIGPTGAAASLPTVLAKEPQFSGWGRGVTFADESVVLLTNVATNVSLLIARIASNGTIAYPTFEIARGIPFVSDTSIVRRGPDAVVMWANDRGIRLTRLAITGTVR